MNKQRTIQLMQLADSVLKESKILRRDKNNLEYIKDAYNSQAASLCVTIAINGLLPALVIFYQQTSESRMVNRRNLIEIIGQMIQKDDTYHKKTAIKDADSLLKAVLEQPGNKELKNEVLDCAIALKQIIRTYIHEEH